ncbi:MAG: hypothetical protein S0880_21385 [Actinomycetota bacterium]|nr:hypothetical protein [Actinomycetota bacterium]
MPQRTQRNRHGRRSPWSALGALMIVAGAAMVGGGAVASADEASDAAVGPAGCGVDDGVLAVEVESFYGPQRPLVGDPALGDTIRTYELPAVLEPGTYEVYGVSSNNFSPEGQDHEQWLVEMNAVRSELMADIPADAEWMAVDAFPDDDGDAATMPPEVAAQLPGGSMGVIELTEPADMMTFVHAEHDGAMDPSPNSVHPRFVTFVCAEVESEIVESTTTTVAPTTTTAAPTTTTAAPTTTQPDVGVLGAHAELPRTGGGTSAAWLGVALMASGAALVVAGRRLAPVPVR